MFNKILEELRPQYLEFVVQEQEKEDARFSVPPKLKSYLVTSIGDKDIYDIPLFDAPKFKEEISAFLNARVYVALAFRHSGEGVYVIDETGEYLNSYPRGDSQVWVRKSKFFIVYPKGDTFYVMGWEFIPYEPYCQNILILHYKVNSVPCNLKCFRFLGGKAGYFPLS